MSQYKVGTISVNQGSNMVSGSPECTFLTAIEAGQGFKVANDPVIYQVSGVLSNTQFSLSTNYGGASVFDSEYQVTRDYTPIFGLTEINPQDQDWAQHLTEGVIRKLDSLLGSGVGQINGDNMVFTDTVTGIKYFLRITNGSFYRVEV